ncbi:hypothetical protein F2Q70_00043257 [Brassica cretica]|uniref:Uncharacterized protein n=1 Tax=Brassica cretica TaxID=69181 RepID=A0A8S9KJN9_BRACR|nr:hypothetical protein F2Q70_00043257 [Brassica cretica]
MGNDYYIPTMATHTMHTEEYDEDYEEERAIEQRATLDEEDRLLDRALARARLLHSDRAGRAFGRYVATELGLELGRYVATCFELSSDISILSSVKLFPTEPWLELGRYVATEPCACSVAT